MDAKVLFLFSTLATVCFIEGAVDTGSNSNVCSSNPCHNDGLCAVNGTKFICQCLHGFTGRLCQEKPLNCTPTLCVSGVCQKDNDGKPQCFCKSGYVGFRCDINQDECASNPCRNGGLCVDRVNGYRCTCKSGFYGLHCEFKDKLIQQCISRCGTGICWHNDSQVVSLEWGYGETLCNTKETCFGRDYNNSVQLSPGDTFLEVQLKPQQIQVGDTLNFTLDENMAIYVKGLRPFIGDKNAFLSCNANTSSGIYVNSQHQKSVHIAERFLTEGVHFFIDNVDLTFRCEFGLRVNVSVKVNKCYQPGSSKQCSDRGQCATDFTQSAFHCGCCGGFRGEYCEKLDHCYSKPCKNNAICTNLDDDQELYKCECAKGYEGRHCNRVIDMCASNPCQNNAPCTPRLNDYSCACPKGYIGKNCAVEVNECDSSPCVNGGTCVNKLGSFQCVCRNGFKGYHCEVNINDCSSKPCAQGTCIDQVNSYKCYCKPGYGGPDCRLNLNECISNPCLNGGFCVDEVNNYRCDCGHGYTGRHCQEDVDLCAKKEFCTNSISCEDKGQSVKCVCKPGYTGANCGIDIHDCVSNPCLNGGTCRDLVNDYQCFCIPGYTGKSCEDEVKPTTAAPPVTHDFVVKILTEDCHLLKDSVLLQGILFNISHHISTACKCDFAMQNIIRQSVSLSCVDTITGKLAMKVIDDKNVVFDTVQCKIRDYVARHNNVVDLGHDTYIQGFYGDVPSQCQKTNVNSDNVLETSTNLAVTVGSLCAVVGLAVAGIVMCCKCRRARPPVKQINTTENDLINDLSGDLLSAVAPTPKSMYRTSGGYHNMGFNGGRFNPENPIPSRKV